MPSPYTPATSQLLRRKQAAEYLGVSIKQFAALGIPARENIKTPRGQKRYWVRDLERWLANSLLENN